MSAPNNSTAAKQLAELQIPFVDPTHDTYNHSRAVWNARVDSKPAFIAQPDSAVQVSQLVHLALAEKLPLAVRGGGHNVHGACVCDGSLVIDLTRMKAITVDAPACTAVAQPGLTIAEFVHAIAAEDRIVTFGSHQHVGLAGLTLSAGIGLLMSRYGLLSDNLLAAEVVLADGSIVSASATDHPDLLWAIRGGGGNFGVVTSLTYRLYPAEPTIAGMLVHPISCTEQGLRFYRDFTRNLPDSLAVFAAIATPPNGVPAFSFFACYTGPLEEGERLLAPLRAFGTPIMDRLGPIPAAAMLEFLAGADPAGGRYAYGTRFLPGLSDDTITQLVKYGNQRTSPASVVVVYEFHGEVRRHSTQESAFPGRDMPYAAGMYASWPSGDDTPHLQWLHSFGRALDPFAAGPGPIGLSNAIDEADVRAAYRGQYARLQQIKAKYDPKNLFCHNYNIRPAAAG